MTKGNDGIWTKTYENITLEAKTYQYKVAANNNWGNGEFPTQGNNQYEIKEAGAYNITFTYNPAKPELTCNASLVGEATEKLLYPANTTIYVTIHSAWAINNARFAAYFFGSNGDNWTDLTNVNNDIYSLTVPAGEWYGMIICRMNPETTENTWNNVWGAQTKDIMYEEGQNHYIITSEDPTWDGNKPNGSWNIYNTNPSALENTTIANIYTQNGMIVADEEITIFSITGQNVTALNGNLKNGVYIVKSANATAKVVIK